MEFVIEPSCLFGIVTSCIEVYPNETAGFLIGDRARRKIGTETISCVSLTVAYPVQTAERARSHVHPKMNFAAYNRARNTIDSLGFVLVGGYHSHPDYNSAKLSKSDLEWFQEEVKELKKNEISLLGEKWLEIVVKINKRDYSSEHYRETLLRETENTIAGVVKIDVNTGYSITMRGYWIDSSSLSKLPANLHYAR